MIFRFRVVLDNDTKEDIFRDIEIRKTDTFEDLHNSITQSFGFDGSEMASFYLSDDEWNQGEEISLFDLSATSTTHQRCVILVRLRLKKSLYANRRNQIKWGCGG